MKSFRLIVSLRLALFPLIFNLSLAQELEISPGDMSFWTEWNGSEESYVWDDNQDTQDSSAKPQNDNNTQENEAPMDSSAMPQNDNLEPIDSSVNVAEWEKIESFWTSDNEVKNLRWKVDEQDTQDSSLNAQNDEGDANNNPGSVSMADQDWNGEQNENEVEPGLNWVEDAQDSSPSVQNDNDSQDDEEL